MSHPMYNPYAPGKQTSTQGQYGLTNVHNERDPRRAASAHVGPTSSFTSAAPSVNPTTNPGRQLPSLLSLPMNYRQQEGNAVVDEDIQRSVDMHISRAREQVRHQPVAQGTPFTVTQREEFLPARTDMTSTSMSSTSQRHRSSDVQSSSNSLDWLPSYKRPPQDESSKMFSSPPSSYPGSSDRSNMQSIPGIGDYNYTVPEKKPVTTTETSRPKYTSESAANILLHFGLEKEDLEHLISFPEDQITPENLPFILRHIRLQKAKRAPPPAPAPVPPPPAPSQSKPYLESQPTPSMSGSGMDRMISSRGAGMKQDTMSSSVLQPSKIIDYGHISKYTEAGGDQIGRTSGKMSLMDSSMQKTMTEVKSGSLPATDSVTGLSSAYSSMRSSLGPTSSDATNRLQTQANQGPHHLSTLTLPKKDIDLRYMSGVSKPPSSKEPEPDRQATSKPKPACTLIRGVHPGRPGLVLIGKGDNTFSKDQNTAGQKSNAAEKMQPKQQIQHHHQQQQQQLKQPVQQQQQLKKPVQQMSQSKQQIHQQPKHQPKQQDQQQKAIQQQASQLQEKQQKAKHLAAQLQVKQQQQQQQQATQLRQVQEHSQLGQRLLSQVMSTKPTPSSSFVPSLMDPSVLHPLFIPQSTAQPGLGSLNPMPTGQSASNQQQPPKGIVNTSIPTPTMMYDYAATTPRTFPHTCSLCNKECTRMKDWITHQNSSLHLENCKLLRTRFKDWDGDVLSLSSASVQDSKVSRRQSRSRSLSPRRRRDSDGRRRRTRSHSRSHSPRRRHDSGTRRDKRRSPSSSYSESSLRYENRWDKRRSHSRSRSYSPRHYYDSDARRDRRRSYSRSPYRPSRRSRSHSRSPRSDRPTSSRYRSRSRSYGRRSSPRRDEKRASPKKSRERRSTPKKSEERQSSPRRSRENRSSSSTEKLAKKLLEASAVQSISNPSDLEAVVKSLAPALLAELAKMKSSSPSSSSSSKGKSQSSSTTQQKGSTSKSSKEKTKIQKKDNDSSTKQDSRKSPSPITVKLRGIRSSVSHKDVEVAVGQFAEKVSSVVLYRSTQEALIRFENEEDAQKLRNAQCLDVKGTQVTVVNDKEDKSKTTSKDSKAPQPKTACTSTPGTKKSAGAAKTPGAKTTTTGKLITKAKVLVSKAKNVSIKPAVKTVKKIIVDGDKTTSDSEQKPAPETSDVKDKESDMTPQETNKETGHETDKPKDVDVEVEANKVKDDLGETKISEPMEVEETKSIKTDPPTCTPTETTSSVSSIGKPQITQTPSETPQTSVKPSPGPNVQGPGTTGKKRKLNSKQKRKLIAVKALIPRPVSPGGTPLTIGEMLDKHLVQDKIPFLNVKAIQLNKLVKMDFKVVLISNLPEYHDGLYTGDDVAEVLAPFGFQYIDDSMYIIPQTRMAFVLMPSVKSMKTLIQVSTTRGVYLKGSKLSVQGIKRYIFMEPLEFYKSLMKLMNIPMFDDGARTIHIKNISQSEAQNLRQALKKIDDVRNFLPLLNEVFIEFKSICDADRLGVWYSLLKQGFGHKVFRLKVPHSAFTSSSPRMPEKAFPDGSDVVAGATVLDNAAVAPPGSTAPFWVTMTTNPFVFPTMSPWFIIPKYHTINGVDDIEKAGPEAAEFHTIMFNNLPEQTYKPEDVAKLVWPYFPRQNLHTLYYNVMVLPLQRRAFVHFNNWDLCSSFVQDYIKNPAYLEDSKVNIHFVLEDLCPGSTEETMYRTLMKWSNSHVPDLDSLEDRLLCVEISEAGAKLVMMVMDVVASIASFASFLPLANRICIEMAEPSGVTEVVEKIHTMVDLTTDQTWSKVCRIEPLKSLKQRLQESSEITIHYKVDTALRKPPSERVKQFVAPSNEKEPVAQETSDPPPSATTTGSVGESPSDVETKETEPGTEIITAESNVAPKTNDDGEKVEVKAKDTATSTETKADENLTPVASSPKLSATGQVQPGGENTVTDVPSMNEDVFRAITAALREHRLSRGIGIQSEAKENPGKNNTNPESEKEKVTSEETGVNDGDPFDEQNFNFEDFVTVDEIGEDVAETSSDHDSSSLSNPPSKRKRESKSSDLASPSPKRSSKDSKSSSSSSSSSKPTSASVKSGSSSRSTSASPKKQKDSSQSTKSQTKTSSSTSSSSQKSQQSKSKSPVRPSHSSTSTSRTRSSKTAAAFSSDTHKKEAKQQHIESAVTKSDHTVSAESDAVKTVESETKIEATSEMHPPAQQSVQPDEDLKQELNQNEKKEARDDKAEKPLPASEQGQDSDKSPEDKTKEACSEEMEVDSSFQVIDSVTEGQAATVQEESTVTPEDSSQVEAEKNEMSNIPASKTREDRKGEKQKDECLSEESSKNVQSSQDHKDDPSKDVTDQESSEMTNEMENDSKKLEGPCDQVPGADIKTIEEEEEGVFQVIDSVEDQQPETKSDTKERKTTRGGNTTTKRDDGPTRRSSSRNKTCESEEKEKSPKKQDKERSKDSSLDKGTTEKAICEVVDSEQSGRRRSARGNKEVKQTISTEVTVKPDAEEEATYEVLDSVEEEAVPEPTTRSTRGRRGRSAKKDSTTEKTKKEETPTRRRQERDTHEGNEEKKEREEGTYQILDSVEDAVVVPEDRPRGRGRPRKDNKTTKKQAAAQKKTKAAEEDAAFQILDSVGDETVDEQNSVTVQSIDQETKSISKNEQQETEEEEPLYEILDSLEEDQVQDESTATKVLDIEMESTTTKEEDMITSCSITPEGFEHDKKENLDQVPEANVDPGSNKKSESDETTDEKQKPQNSPEVPKSTLVNLDEVSEEEEDYPDDTAEKEELKKKQAAAKEKKQREERKKKEKERDERRSRSRSRGGGGGGGGGGREMKEEKQEEVVVEEELVTLDEVGADDEKTPDAPAEWDPETAEGDLQGLVTLDEIFEEEEEEKTRPLIQEENQSVDNVKPETSIEEGDNKDKGKADEEEAERKPKHEDETEESSNFVTVDEVGEAEEEEKEAAPTRTRGRAKKRGRQTPVRKSTRGSIKIEKDDEEKESLPLPASLDSASSLDKNPPETSSDENVKQTEVCEGPDEQREERGGGDEEGKEEEGEEEGWSQADGEVSRKRPNDTSGPEAKRSRSQSPSVSSDVKLPPFTPNNPLGREFVSPTSGFFCNLCSVFYLNEKTAKDVHCSSRRHYDNLQKHYQKLQCKKTSTTQNSQGSVSD